MRGGADMAAVLFLLMLTGVGYISWLLVRFIVWLDGADECGEKSAQDY